MLKAWLISKFLKSKLSIKFYKLKMSINNKFSTKKANEKSYTIFFHFEQKSGPKARLLTTNFCNLKKP